MKTQKEILKGFFNEELKNLEVKTGCNQFARIHALKDGAKEMVRLIDILVEACLQPPFDKMSAEVKMRVIQDQMMRDDQFVSPPFGQLSGFNKRIVFKWLNAHYHQHEQRIEESESSKPITYGEYLELCKKHGMVPMAEDEFDKPMTPERMKAMTEQYQKNLAGITDSKKVYHNPLRDKYQTSALKQYNEETQVFEINGIEIRAYSEEQANMLYKKYYAQEAPNVQQ